MVTHIGHTFHTSVSADGTVVTISAEVPFNLNDVREHIRHLQEMIFTEADTRFDVIAVRNGEEQVKIGGYERSLTHRLKQHDAESENGPTNAGSTFDLRALHPRED